MTTLPAVILGYDFILRALSRDDIEQVRQWRNHPEIARHMLTNDYISQEQQQRWFASVSQAQDRAYYMICWREVNSGLAYVISPSNCSLDKAIELEAGIYFDPKSPLRGNMLAFAPALALNDACFEALPNLQLLAKVKEDNMAALRFNAALGYREKTRESGLVHFALEQENYLEATRTLRTMLLRYTNPSRA